MEECEWRDAQGVFGNTWIKGLLRGMQNTGENPGWRPICLFLLINTLPKVESQFYPSEKRKAKKNNLGCWTAEIFQVTLLKIEIQHLFILF